MGSTLTKKEKRRIATLYKLTDQLNQDTVSESGSTFFSDHSQMNDAFLSAVRKGMADDPEIRSNIDNLEGWYRRITGNTSPRFFESVDEIKKEMGTYLTDIVQPLITNFNRKIAPVLGGGLSIIVPGVGALSQTNDMSPYVQDMQSFDSVDAAFSHMAQNTSAPAVITGNGQAWPDVQDAIVGGYDSPKNMVRTWHRDISREELVGLIELFNKHSRIQGSDFEIYDLAGNGIADDGVFDRGEYLVLPCISGLQVLAEKVKSNGKYMDQIGAEVDEMLSRMNDMKGQIEEMDGSIDDLNSQYNGLRSDVGSLKSNFDSLKSDRSFMQFLNDNINMELYLGFGNITTELPGIETSRKGNIAEVDVEAAINLYKQKLFAHLMGNYSFQPDNLKYSGLDRTHNETSGDFRALLSTDEKEIIGFAKLGGFYGFRNITTNDAGFGIPEDTKEFGILLGFGKYPSGNGLNLNVNGKLFIPSDKGFDKKTGYGVEWDTGLNFGRRKGSIRPKYNFYITLSGENGHRKAETGPVDYNEVGAKIGTYLMKHFGIEGEVSWNKRTDGGFVENSVPVYMLRLKK